MIAALGGEHAQLAHAEANFEDHDAPHRLVNSAVERFGPLDTLVVNHARSSLGELSAVTAEELDRTWAINVRATLLLVQASPNNVPAMAEWCCSPRVSTSPR